MMGMFGWSYPAGAAGDPYAPYNDTTGEDDMTTPKLTKSQKAKIKRIRRALDNLVGPTVPPVTWAEYWRALEPFLPQISTGEEFAYDDECDVEHYPVLNDDDTWGKVAYALDHGRDEDGLYICARMWDGDDWDYADEVREDATPEEFAQFLIDYTGTDDYFRAWAKYFIWCAENGGDPIDAYWKKDNLTADDHIKSAQDDLRYLRMGRNRKAKRGA